MVASNSFKNKLNKYSFHIKITADTSALISLISFANVKIVEPY